MSVQIARQRNSAQTGDPLRRQQAAELLALHRQAKRRLRDAEASLLEGARREGLTWDEIGDALGITGEGARIAYVKWLADQTDKA